MTRLILDIESSLSPGTLFERASQALRECKLTECWEIQSGEAFELESLPAAGREPASLAEDEGGDGEVCECCDSPDVTEHDVEGIPLCCGCWAQLLADSDNTEESGIAAAIQQESEEAQPNVSAMRKRIAAAHQEAEHAI